MKRILCYLILALFVTVVSCEKEDTHVFKEAPSVRVEKVLSSFEESLVGAENGWIATISTGTGGGYSFWIDFDDKNRVKMLSDFDEETAVKVGEASYRLKDMQQPTLIFDTYSYIHLLADPNSNVNGGESGLGYESDFEFYLTDSVITKLKGQSAVKELNLMGRFNQSRFKMVKATATEKEAYLAGKLATEMSEIEKYVNDHYFFYLEKDGGKDFQLAFDLDGKSLSLTWSEGADSIASVEGNFAYGVDGIYVIDSIPISHILLSSIHWDQQQNALQCIFADGSKQYLQTADNPVLPYPELGEVWGYNKEYNVMNINLAQSPAYNAAFTAAENILKQQSSSYYLRYAKLVFVSGDELRLDLGYHSSSDFKAFYYYHYTMDLNTKEITIGSEYVKDNGGSNGNGALREGQLQDAWSFFENKTFVLEWPPGQPALGSSNMVGKISSDSDTSLFARGRIDWEL